MNQILSAMSVDSLAGCIVLLILGIFLVVKGGDWFVDSASKIAEISGIPTFIIGATIVSLATTLPEILVSSISAAEGNAGMAIGNAVGSVNCNIALIMAISLLFLPTAFKRKDFAAKMIILLVAVATLWTVSAVGKTVQWWEALIVLVIFLAFMVENVLSAKKHSKEQIKIDEPVKASELPDDGAKTSIKESGSGILFYYQAKQDKQYMTVKRTGITIKKSEFAKCIIFFFIGAAAIVIGAQLMCDNATYIASVSGMSDDLIGVTILAVGTSLPELVTTITAIIKKKSDLSVGNVIGANIIDITLIMPICAIISAAKFGTSLPVSPQSLVLDFPFCMAISLFTVVPALIFGKFKRWQGGLLLAGYITYITLLILNTVETVAIF